MELKDRFKLARKHIGLSQHQLADVSHTSQMKISKIERGLTLQPRDLGHFARLFKVSEEWLQFGVNPPEWLESEDNDKKTSNYTHMGYFREVPIVSWVKAGDFCSNNSQASVDDFEMIICPEEHASERTFALRVVGDSMTNPFGRSYPEGTIIFVDPLKSAVPGNRVIARTDKGHTFKELAENEFGEYYLKPLNPNHAPIFGNDIEICGVVIGSYWKE